MLEAKEHDVSCMVTLTIREEQYAKAWHPPLVPGFTHGKEVLVREAQDFLKRLRVAGLRRGQSRSFRYYIVGEYGDSARGTNRAHYHAALFGFGNLGVIASCWPYGRVQLDELNERTAAYICGYMAEKGSKDYELRVAGRAHEFARMSLRPGLGALQADRIAMALGENRDALQKMVDVPTSLVQNGRRWPVGRYLSGRIREMAGYGGRVPEEAHRGRAMELVAKVSDKGSTRNYLEWRERRREHDAVKAAQRLTQSSKRMKGSLE